MRRISMVTIYFALCTVLHALEYVESSVGLQDPQWESGRTELELADINEDGNVDILSIGDHGSPYVNTLEHGIMVWFGDGTGSWSVFQNGNFGYGGIAVGDLNNDNHMDVGYGMHHNYSGTDFGDSILEASLGDGTGQNWMPWDDGISIGNPDQWGMFCTDLADVNSDGLLDLGANSFGYGDGIHVFLNNGDGTWDECFGFIGGNSTMDFCFGDINADGNADFAAAHQYGSVYLGDGNGNFAAADGNLPPGGLVGRRGPSLGDIDNDGDQDLAFCNSDGGVEVWSWLGNDTWSDASGSLPVSGSYVATQLCDMNIDGYMDVVAFGAGITTVWSGDGSGTWTSAAIINTPTPGTLGALRVGADADHNGYPDIALVAKEGSMWTAVNTLRFFKEMSVTESLFVFPAYPRGGEVFKCGSVRFIKWTCGVPVGETAHVRLELSTSGASGPWTEIADSLPDNGRYQYTVAQGINSSECYIRYTAVTSGDTVDCISVFPFTISDGTGADIAATCPASGRQRISIVPSVGSGGFAVHISTSGGDSKRAVIYDRCGNLVRDLIVIRGTGRFVVPWDGRDERGRLVPAGIYYVSVAANDRVFTAKVVVVR
ncbi:MAG: VCBS repeat-containing protein [candidate division WOR-3 bacterium]|nr:MAG: VCBS repeat-containing protein [candidate division WOR-3 bacterium]